MLVMPLRWARMAPTIAATCDSARPPGIGTVGIPSICAGILPAVMPMRSIVLQNCLNRSWDGFSSAMPPSSPVGGPRAGANPQRERRDELGGRPPVRVPGRQPDGVLAEQHQRQARRERGEVLGARRLGADDRPVDQVRPERGEARAIALPAALRLL